MIWQFSYGFSVLDMIISGAVFPLFVSGFSCLALSLPIKTWAVSNNRTNKTALWFDLFHWAKLLETDLDPVQKTWPKTDHTVHTQLSTCRLYFPSHSPLVHISKQAEVPVHKILLPSEKTSLVWSLSFHWHEPRAQDQSDYLSRVSLSWIIWYPSRTQLLYFSLRAHLCHMHLIMLATNGLVSISLLMNPSKRNLHPSC